MIHDDPCILSIKNGHKIRGFGTRISGCHPLKCPTMDPTPNWWQHRHCAMPLAFLSFLTEVQRGKKNLSPKKMDDTIYYSLYMFILEYELYYIYIFFGIDHILKTQKTIIHHGRSQDDGEPQSRSPHSLRTSKPFKKGLGIWIWHLPSGNLFCRKSPFWMSKTHINGPFSIAISCVCWSSSRFD